MSILTAYKMHPDAWNIEPLSIKRDWMDATPEKHAYRCFPVTMANQIGWSISCKQDIRFIWDGINDTTMAHIEILEGPQGSNAGRGQSTVSFNIGYIFRSEQNISLLTMTAPNYFHEGFEVMSSMISTSFFNNDFPLAIKATIPNKEIIIKSGTPIAALLPISVSSLKDESIEILDFNMTEEYQEAQQRYGDAAQILNKSGEWTDWYRDAVNEKGESLGSHEAKVLRLSVVDKSRGAKNA